MKNDEVKKFRINSKCFFLTYSQVPEDQIDLYDIENNLKLFFEKKNIKIEWYVIGKEHHEDGGVHYHIIFVLEKPYDCKNQYSLDVIAGGDGEGGKWQHGPRKGTVAGHGKYEATRNKIKVLGYCIKEGNYIEEGIDAKEYINSRTKKKSTIYATKLRDNEMDIKDIIKEDPEFYFTHKRKIDEFTVSVKKVKYEEEFKKHTNIDVKLYGWQKEAVQLLDKQSSREVLWIYETEGKTGKTDLAKWLHANKGAYLVRGGKVIDITKGYDYEKLVIFDYPRESTEFINYALIEMFKDGVIQSNKYDSHVKYCYGVTVVVFANVQPDLSNTISKDRIQLYEIKDKKKLNKIKI